MERCPSSRFIDNMAHLTSRSQSQSTPTPSPHLSIPTLEFSFQFIINAALCFPFPCLSYAHLKCRSSKSDPQMLCRSNALSTHPCITNLSEPPYTPLKRNSILMPPSQSKAKAKAEEKQSKRAKAKEKQTQF